MSRHGNVGEGPALSTAGAKELRAASGALQAGEGDARLAELAVEGTACLFACAQPRSIHLRAPSKIGYVLGRFEPTAEAARAILDYAAACVESEDGVVPFRCWRQGVKGHFIVRPRHDRRQLARTGARGDQPVAVALSAASTIHWPESRACS